MKNDFKYKTCKALKTTIQNNSQKNLFNWVAHCHKSLNQDLENYFEEEKWTDVKETKQVSDVYYKYFILIL